MKERFQKLMAECPAIAILRGITTAEVPAVCDILCQAGITLLEIPLNSPDALKSIECAARHCGDKQMVGAGTVLTQEEAISVHQAGGCFVISPNTDPDVIRTTKACKMLSIPGFFTATEAFTALRAGADYLKLFPALLGPGYIKDLKAVVKAPILAVGGVNTQNMPDFLKVCQGVGIGSALYKSGKSLDEIRTTAEEIVSVVRRSIEKHYVPHEGR